MNCAGVLLTGGLSRRMGRDKASLEIGAGGSRVTLATRTAALLATVCDPVIEVGPGYSPLPAVTESPAGQGPLAGMVAGWRALTSAGWSGAVMVVATDLPNLDRALLQWLADYPADRSVVPVAGGRVQPLCARYSPTDMELAARLVGDGARAMTALLDATDPELVPEDRWAAVAGRPDALADVDTPEDLDRVRGT